MSLEMHTPTDSLKNAREAVAKAKLEFRRKHGFSPIQLRNRRTRIIESLDRAAVNTSNENVRKVYANAKRDLENMQIDGKDY